MVSSFLFCFGICRELIRLSVQFSECMTAETIQGVFITLFLLTSSSLNGQISWSGTFGDNIFENGDFGSGPEVIYPEDPEIAPGYIYTVHTPPEDGYYTLTNDMGQWMNNQTDRKSTSLNSSNVDISYDVFCLKTILKITT